MTEMHALCASAHTRRAAPFCLRACFLASAVGLAACGDLGCPAEFENASGVCVAIVADVPMQPEPELPEQPSAPEEPSSQPEAPPEELCDGVDNDGDDLIDEDFPELDAPCGEGMGIGECELGRYVCNEGGDGIVCIDAIGPAPEVCDGLDNDCDGTADNGPAEVCDGADNDCDGLIDEGVLSVKREPVFQGLASVAAVRGGFAVARAIGDRMRVETFSTDGARTGHADEFALGADDQLAFVESDGSEDEFFVIWGKDSPIAGAVLIDDALLPVAIGSQVLAEEWDSTLGFTRFPPFHPRVSADAKRVVGFPQGFEMSVAAFGDDLSSLDDPPVAASEPLNYVAFDIAGTFLVGEEGDRIRGSVVRDDGGVRLDTDVGEGSWPSVSNATEFLGIAWIFNGRLQLSELGGLSPQCVSGKFCGEIVEGGDLNAPAEGPTALDYQRSRDIWFIGAGAQVTAVGRNKGRAVPIQVTTRSDLSDPNRIDVAVSGGSVAIMQSNDSGRSALTFLGCF